MIRSDGQELPEPISAHGRCYRSASPTTFNGFACGVERYHARQSTPPAVVRLIETQLTPGQAAR